MSIARAAGTVLSLAPIVVGAGAVYGEVFPNKPIRLVTAAVGGGGDFTARLMAPGLASSLGQQMIVDNRPGAATIPTLIVVKAPPDGYTLLLSGGGIIFGPLLQKLPFDPLRDLAPVTWTDKSHSVLVVHPSVEATSVKELIALAKAKPGALNYATGATGTTAHLGGELFNYLAGVHIVRVPYKGGASNLNAVLAGEVQMVFISANVVTGHLKSQKLRALAVTSPEPSDLYPDLPTVAATLPGYELTQITAVFAPANTPAAIISRLNRVMTQSLNAPDVKQRFLNDKVEVVASSPAQLGAMMKSEITRWGKVIKAAGIRAD